MTAAIGEGRGAPPPIRTSARSNSSAGLGYLAGTDPEDPLVAPINSPEMLAKFPPTLVITATRGFELSGAVYRTTSSSSTASMPNCTSGTASFTDSSTIPTCRNRAIATTSSLNSSTATSGCRSSKKTWQRAPMIAPPCRETRSL